ncbi:MAG: GNAT family N-acetyltransferase [bacterium]
MEDINIKLAKEEDLQEVLRLYGQLWENFKFDLDVVKERFKRDLDTRRKDYYLAILNEKVIGVCAMTYREDIWDGNIASIEELVVDKDFRGKGLGKKLLEYITQIAKEKNCYSIELHSNMKRLDAHRFYENNGFDKKSYYFEKIL